ncbi:unnamed protein product, partial [Nesidiocoris tenuis]
MNGSNRNRLPSLRGAALLCGVRQARCAALSRLDGSVVPGVRHSANRTRDRLGGLTDGSRRPGRIRFSNVSSRPGVPQREHGSSAEGSCCQLWTDGPSGCFALASTKHRPIRWRFVQRYHGRPRDRSRLHKFPHDIAYCYAR